LRLDFFSQIFVTKVLSQASFSKFFTQALFWFFLSQNLLCLHLKAFVSILFTNPWQKFSRKLRFQNFLLKLCFDFSQNLLCLHF
jgi:hypothetical protein